MFFRDLLRLTSSTFVSYPLRSFLTGLGIAIGVAAVILLTSIGEGLRQFVLSEFTQFGTNIITIQPGKTQTHGANIVFFLLGTRQITQGHNVYLWKAYFRERHLPMLNVYGTITPARTLLLSQPLRSSTQWMISKLDCGIYRHVP